MQRENLPDTARQDDDAQQSTPLIGMKHDGELDNRYVPFSKEISSLNLPGCARGGEWLRHCH